jgi:hypothetical protein
MKTYRIYLNSADRNSGTVDNAIFNVNFPILDPDSSVPWMLWLEEFYINDQDSNSSLASETYHVRLRQMANSTVFSTDSKPNDILSLVKGFYHDRLAPSGHEGIVVHDKTFFNSKQWNVYLTSPRFTSFQFLTRAYPPSVMESDSQTYNGIYCVGTYVASASTNNSQAYYVFNNNGIYGTFWSSSANLYSSTSGNYTGTVKTHDLVTVSDVFGEYVQLQCPQSISITSFTMSVASANAPTELALMGSWDGQNFYLIQEFQNVTWNSNYTNTFTLSSPSQHYTYLRVVVQAITIGGTYAQINDLVFTSELTWSAVLVAWKPEKKLLKM